MKLVEDNSVKLKLDKEMKQQMRRPKNKPSYHLFNLKQCWGYHNMTATDIEIIGNSTMDSSVLGK
ncbi:hypothetical protein C0J52_10225 [Blattella germanica]|nr:hypothetical protein C0J52_10225 [Blattella germanica]